MESVLSDIDLLYIILGMLPVSEYYNTRLVSLDFRDITKKLITDKKTKGTITTWLYSDTPMKPYYGKPADGCLLSDDYSMIGNQYVTMDKKDIKQPILIITHLAALIRIDFSIFNTGMVTYLSDFIVSYVDMSHKKKRPAYEIIKCNIDRIVYMINIAKKLFDCNLSIHPDTLARYL